MMLVGTSSSPSSATTKVLPLKSTARLAVAPASAIASSCVAPPAALLAVAGDDEERVVDPEREPHAEEHVHDEDGEAELEREQRDEAEPDHDRDDRHQHGNQSGDDRAEHEQQDHERGGKPEAKLTVLQVAGREGAEVVCRRCGRR